MRARLSLWRPADQLMHQSVPSQMSAGDATRNAAGWLRGCADIWRAAVNAEAKLDDARAFARARQARFGAVASAVAALADWRFGMAGHDGSIPAPPWHIGLPVGGVLMRACLTPLVDAPSPAAADAMRASESAALRRIWGILSRAPATSQPMLLAALPRRLQPASPTGPVPVRPVVEEASRKIAVLGRVRAAVTVGADTGERGQALPWPIPGHQLAAALDALCDLLNGQRLGPVARLEEAVRAAARAVALAEAHEHGLLDVIGDDPAFVEALRSDVGPPGLDYGVLAALRPPVSVEPVFWAAGDGTNASILDPDGTWWTARIPADFPTGAIGRASWTGPLRDADALRSAVTAAGGPIPLEATTTALWDGLRWAMDGRADQRGVVRYIRDGGADRLIYRGEFAPPPVSGLAWEAFGISSSRPPERRG